MISKKALNLCDAIREAGGTPYIVGGFVRDLVMGRESHDEDIVVVGINPNNMTKLCLELNGQAVGKEFPVMVINGIEVAMARKEKKIGSGHDQFACYTKDVSLEEDLFRRDLRMNAMALDPYTHEIIDPFNGRRDINEKLMSSVGPHFGEDPLRVLRVARFGAQLEMGLTENLIRAANEVIGELSTLPGERIFAELLKALKSNKPSIFFHQLDVMGALGIVFPEIYALKGRVQPEKYHPEGDAYVHTLQVMDRARELDADDETMFAALVHDLGKAVTPDDNLPHHYNHEALGVPLVDALCDYLKTPTSFRKAGRLTAKEHLNIHRFQELKPVKKVRLIGRLGGFQDDTWIKRVSLASQADAQGRGPEYWNAPYPQRQALIDAARKVRNVKGDQFSAIKDGRVIAQKMEQARARALQN